jgi:putative transposase
MRYVFIRAEKVRYPIASLCRVLRVSRSGYYHWSKGDRSVRELRDAELLDLIREIFKQSRKTYGSPRIYDELRDRRVSCSLSRVERLMRQHGITPPKKRRFRRTTDSDHPFPPAPNLLGRDFSSPGPDRRWVADITYVWTREGWLYLAVILDLFSRRVVGWSMRRTLNRELVLAALTAALSGRGSPFDLTVHSDRGSQYCSDDHRKILRQRKIACSMSRRGDCWDNAVAESFFATLKRELVHRRDFATRAQAQQEIFEYIEVFYNRQRKHSYLGYLAPVEFEKVAALAA